MTKAIIKWSVTFGALALWTVLVVNSFSTDIMALEPNTNAPIYLQTQVNNHTLIEKANLHDLIDYLFRHDFTSEYSFDTIPQDVCSARARGGDSIVIDLPGERNKLNLRYSHRGVSGQITIHSKQNRASAKLTNLEIMRNDDVFIAAGTAMVRINSNQRKEQHISIEFDKLRNLTSIISDNFTVHDMPSNILKGCGLQTIEFYRVTDHGLIGRIRSIEEVRDLLEQHPEFQDNFEQLRQLFKEFLVAHHYKPNNI